MTALQASRALGWLVRDTIRQSVASRVLWLFLGLSAVAVLVCLSVRVEGGAVLERPGEHPDFLPSHDPQAASPLVKRDGVDIVSGELTLAFGAFRMPLVRDARDAVRFLEVVLAGGVGGVLGLFLTLVWTAGFLPDFLAPRASAVLAARPVPRWFLFLGKCLGVFALVAGSSAVLVGGTWLALGVRTGVWDTAYLWCAPLLAVEFAVFFSVSAWVAAHLRATPACVLASVLFWGLCWGMNYGRHAVVALPHLAPGVARTSPLIRAVVEAGYWVLPKPADLGMVLTDVVGAGPHVAAVPEFEAVRNHHAFFPVASVLTSLAASALILLAAVRRYEAFDY